jgi:pyruvate dehydrogenase E2 component (dihydrolipoamide acetyltransferase)
MNGDGNREQATTRSDPIAKRKVEVVYGAWTPPPPLSPSTCVPDAPPPVPLPTATPGSPVEEWGSCSPGWWWGTWPAPALATFPGAAIPTPAPAPAPAPGPAATPSPSLFSRALISSRVLRGSLRPMPKAGPTTGSRLEEDEEEEVPSRCRALAGGRPPAAAAPAAAPEPAGIVGAASAVGAGARP